MKPPPFSYARPNSVESALEILESDPYARVLAGGQSLIPLLNFRLAAPTTLVDIGGIDRLRQIDATDDGVAIGAMVTQRRLETSRELKRRFPILGRALALVGHVQNRNRGTIGGSLAHADPAAELPAVAVAFDAELIATSRAGVRSIPAAEFFTGPYETALEPGEMLTKVWFPDERGDEASIQELASRHGDFAVAGVVGRLGVDDGVVARAALVVFGVSSVPVRVTGAEAALVGGRLDDDAIAAAAAQVEEASATGYGDVHASSEYRSRLAGELAKRTLEEMAA